MKKEAISAVKALVMHCQQRHPVLYFQCSDSYRVENAPEKVTDKNPSVGYRGCGHRGVAHRQYDTVHEWQGVGGAFHGDMRGGGLANLGFCKSSGFGIMSFDCGLLIPWRPTTPTPEIRTYRRDTVANEGLTLSTGGTVSHPESAARDSRPGPPTPRSPPPSSRR